jgi:hypothetical protein
MTANGRTESITKEKLERLLTARADAQSQVTMNITV